MQKLDLAGIVFALFVSFCVTCPPVVTADGPDIPMPEMTVTRTDAPPTIDGKMEPGEWDRATACTAFTVASKHYLAPVQSTAYVTYDDEYIYVAIKNLRGEKTPLLEKRARQPDDSSIVFDPSNEIWFTPPTSPQVTYQTLFNAYPGVFDAKMIPSVGYTAMSWSADWEIAASETKNHWIVEGRSKIKAYGSDGIEDGTTWRGLFTADIGDGYGFRAWAPGEGFSKIQRHGTLNFAADAPTFQFQDCETIFSGHPEFSMSVTASDRAKAEVDVSLRFGPDVEPTDEDVVVERTVAVDAGDSATFTMGADLTELNLPEKKLRVKSTGEEGEFPRGYGEVTAKTADGQTLYHQEFPFRITDWKRRPPEQIKTTPYDEDFGIKAKYAPMNKKVLVTVDRHYMEERERVANGKARLVDAESGEVVAQCELDPFYYDYSKFPLDVQHVDVPVETPDEWRAKKEGEGSGEQPDIYNLEVSLTDAEGNEVATAAREVGLMGYEFEWLPNDVGESDKVIKPWTPLKWDDGALSMWNKTYDLNGLGMADNIDNDGAPQLSDMKLVAVVDGEEVEVDPDTLNMQNLTEANADLTGTAKIAGVDVEVDTHAEFDGFVRNTMRLNPQTPTSIDRLSAVFTMSKEEAPLMVSTVGGWYSYHGFTPEKWDSTDVALSNMIYNQVPYVLLTDSDRGFSWFADSVEGWILDEDEPTVELWTENDTVTLRVNFISRSTTLEEPTSMTWGWMVTPQKPQPEGWRNWIIGTRRMNPKMEALTWRDADWAVVYPYYSSPFPWSYEKSREKLSRDPERGITGCVGNIAHSIGRYMDYKKRKFNKLAADWGQEPGNKSMGNVARSEGPNDFQVWHWNRWVEKAGLHGSYFDETYLHPDWNYLTGGAFRLPDGRVQCGYNYVGLRNMTKRLRYVYDKHDKPIPNIWFHTTGGHPVYAWLCDVSMEAENVKPTGGKNDYIDALPAGRLRAIAMGRNLGTAPFVMCQARRHWLGDDTAPHIVRQFVGWVLLHDALPEQVTFWHALASEMEMWHSDYEFLPYWKEDEDLGVGSPTDNVLVSAHARPGMATVWALNKAWETSDATVALDLKKLGFTGDAPIVVFDAETGERYDMDEGVLKVELPSRSWRAIRLVQSEQLESERTFVARFDEKAVANAALGNPLPDVNLPSDIPLAKAEGKDDRGLLLDQELQFQARHNIPARGEGRVDCDIKVDGEGGRVLSFADVKISAQNGKLRVVVGDQEAEVQMPSGWHHISVQWNNTPQVKVMLDGEESATLELEEAITLSMPRGVYIQNHRLRTKNVHRFTLGEADGTVIDNLVFRR